MINPGKLMKLKQDKDQFVRRHSDLVRFLETHFGGDVHEGDELTITYNHQGDAEDSCTVKLTAEDVNVIHAISKIL